MLFGGRGDKKVAMMGSAKVDSRDLEAIGELLKTGKVVPVIDKAYPLAATADALRHFEVEHARGKIIISVVETE